MRKHNLIGDWTVENDEMRMCTVKSENILCFETVEMAKKREPPVETIYFTSFLTVETDEKSKTTVAKQQLTS